MVAESRVASAPHEAAEHLPSLLSCAGSRSDLVFAFRPLSRPSISAPGRGAIYHEPGRHPLYPSRNGRVTAPPASLSRRSRAQERFWDPHDGNRNPGGETRFRQMSDDDITNTFKQACAFRRISQVQRDRAVALWWDLRATKDITVPMRTLATFGCPLPR